MLLITRREGEAIVVNGSIEVRVLEIRGGRVKLGFEYPNGCTVFRQELFAKIQAENRAAAQALNPAGPVDPASLTAVIGKLGTAGASGKGNQKEPTRDAIRNTNPDDA